MLTAAAALLTGTGQAPFIPHATARGHLALLWGPGRDPGRPSSRDLQHRVDHPDWRGALTQYTRRRSSVPSGRTPVAPPLTKVPAVGVTCPGPNCRTTAIVPAARLPRAGLNPCRLTNPPQPRWPGARGPQHAARWGGICLWPRGEYGEAPPVTPRGTQPGTGDAIPRSTRTGSLPVYPHSRVGLARLRPCNGPQPLLIATLPGEKG